MNENRMQMIFYCHGLKKKDCFVDNARIANEIGSAVRVQRFYNLKLIKKK